MKKIHAESRLIIIDKPWAYRSASAFQIIIDIRLAISEFRALDGDKLNVRNDSLYVLINNDDDYALIRNFELLSQDSDEHVSIVKFLRREYTKIKIYSCFDVSQLISKGESHFWGDTLNNSFIK